MAVSNSTRSRGKETGKSATRDSIVDIWGARTPYSGEWPERVDERTLDEPERWVRAACALCSAGCALDIGMKDGRIVGVHGRAVDRVNRGCPCDYTGVTYVKLSQGSGIPWPCNEKYPDGAERLYTNGKFSTDADYCEIYGHDLMTGAAIELEKYRANNPKGRQSLKPPIMFHHQKSRTTNILSSSPPAGWSTTGIRVRRLNVHQTSTMRPQMFLSRSQLLMRSNMGFQKATWSK